MPGPKAISWLLTLVCAGFLAAAPVDAKGLLGWTDDQLAKRAADYARLDPAAIAKAVTIQADDLEPHAVLTTESAYKFKGGFTNEVRADSFLRVFINRATGATTWQVYQRLTYSFERREFDGANYAGRDGPVSTRLVIADSKLNMIYGLKSYQDTLAFEISEMLVRELASRSATTPGVPWRFRFKSRVGMDWTDNLPPAEFAGMLLAVERWRAEHPIG